MFFSLSVNYDSVPETPSFVSNISAILDIENFPKGMIIPHFWSYFS